MPNFWKGFTENFDLRPAVNTIADEISSKKKNQELLNREKELQDYRQNLKDIEDQKQQRLLSELLNGTTSDLEPRFAPTLQGNQLIGGQQPQQIVNRELTPQEKISKIVGLNPNSRAIYENYLKQKATADLQNQENQAFQNYLKNPQGFDYGQASTKTLQRIAEYKKLIAPPKFSKTVKTPKGWYGITQDGQGIPLPQIPYRPDVIGRVPGEDENGNKAEQIFFDNGTSKKLSSSLKGGKIQDAEAFKKTITMFAKTIGDIKKQEQIYNSNKTGKETIDAPIRSNINDQINIWKDILEINMPDEAKKRLDEFYQYAKKKNINLDDYQNAQQDYNKFIDKNFMDEPLGGDPNTKAAVQHALHIWGQYKFGYLPNPNGGTDNNVPQKQSQIPTGAINYLKQHPDTKNKFEELFGKGSADKYLK